MKFFMVIDSYLPIEITSVWLDSVNMKYSLGIYRLLVGVSINQSIKKKKKNSHQVFLICFELVIQQKVHQYSERCMMIKNLGSSIRSVI